MLATATPSRPRPIPVKEAAAQARHAQEQARAAAFVAEGSAAVRTVYSDGGQNPYFAALLRKGAKLGEVSRPEALAYAGIDEVVTPARGICAKKGRCPEAVLNGPGLAKPAEATPVGAPAADKADQPAQAAPRIYFFAAHATPLPATEPLTLAPEPLSYKLGRPAPQQTVIAGAMPILPAVWFD